MIHKREIIMDSTIFGKSDYEELAKFMNWQRTTFEEAKAKIQKIKIKVEVIEKV